MNIQQAKQELINTVRAYLVKDEFGNYEIPIIRQRPMLLIGPPGVGKTQIMDQISKECQIGLVSYTMTHHTRQSAMGLPMIQQKKYGEEDYATTQYTMSEIIGSIYEKIEKTKLREGILFLDEINCVSETLAPAMLQLLQCKRFGAHEIPEGWIIVAAGNPPEFNKSVREFDIVTLDRIRLIQVEAEYSVWKQYAKSVGIHPAVDGYLSLRPAHMCQIETTVDGRFFVTPRGWEDLSELIKIYEKLNVDVNVDVIMEYIQHPKIAKSFGNYLELYYNYKKEYEVALILEGKSMETVLRKIEKAPFDERVCMVQLLLSGLDVGFQMLYNLESILEYMQERLHRFKVESFANYREFLLKMEEEFQSKKEKELLSLKELKIGMKALEQLKQYGAKLNHAEKEQTWEQIQILFEESAQQYEQEWSDNAKKIEYSFDFMESAFMNGQELVLFLSELSAGYYSLHFLKEYKCERYYNYNKMFLFEEEEKRIKEYLEKEGE